MFSTSKAGEMNFLGTQELVNDFAEGKVKLDALEKEELPEELRDKSAEEREKILGEKAKEREDLTQRIQELNEKRQAHIRKQLEENKLDKEGSLDYGIFECIKTQGAKRGLTFKDKGPSL